MQSEIKYVIDKLEESGHEAFLVGGCVRDFLMGREPKDFDVTTNALPEEVHSIFKDEYVIDTGIKHGTVTVIKNHVPVEVTTFRTESQYSDGRHPDSVSFSTNLEDDLARRDFTVNAVAFSDKRGFVDPFNGRVDIEHKVLKAVGNPIDRFSEDGLRIMRALRFSSQLEFTIDEETSKAIHSEKGRLNLISKERIQKELEGLLCGNDVERVLRDYSDVIGVVIPEITPMIGFDQRTHYHIYDVWEHSIRVVSGTPGTPVLRLAALFHDIGKPSCFRKDKRGVGHFYGHPEVSFRMADAIMRRLKFDNETRNKVLTLVRWHDLRPRPTEKAVRKALVKVGAELFDDWIKIKVADNLAQAPELRHELNLIYEVEEIGHRLISEEGVLSIDRLKISGADLIEMGLKEGPEIGATLNKLFEDVLGERISNNRDELIERAKKYLQ